SMLYTNNEKDSNNKIKFEIPNSKKLYSLNNNATNIDRNNQFLFSKTIDGNKFLSFYTPTSEKSQIKWDGININYNAIMNESVGSSTIRSNLANDNYRLVIEYNNNPLFLINKQISYNINDKFYDVVRRTFFNNPSPSDSDLLDMQNYSQKFTSRNFKKLASSSGYFNVLDNDGNKIKKDSNGKWKFEYKEKDGYDPYYVQPSLKNKTSNLDSLKINAIADIYNTIKIQNGNREINDLNDPEDIVFFYNNFLGGDLSPVNLSYREFLSNGVNQALSLYNGQKVSLFDNQQDLDYFISKNSSLTPGEVNIFIDYRGVVINPGIKQTGDDEYVYTSDAIYDTKEEILENLNRTFIVPKSDEKVYYDEGNGVKTLVDNQLNQIYRLKITNASNEVIESYFTTYEDCLNALNRYIKAKTSVALIR
ncbi:MAG: hypothetical protein K2I49_01635, partial [Ureaplasma sp.]|nr:hypothetical protein [Ureaplasma sp.]